MKMNRTVLSVLLLALCVMLLCAGCAGVENAENTAPATTVAPTETLPPETLPPETVPPTEPVATAFPENTVLCGVDLSGMDAEQAHSALVDAVRNYTLSVSINGAVKTFTAEELGIGVAGVDFSKLIQAASAEPDDRGALEKGLIVYGDHAVTEAIDALPSLDVAPRNASLRYNSGTGRFELQSEADGFGIDPEPVQEAARTAIVALQKEVVLELPKTNVPAKIRADSDAARQALERANTIFNVNLRYTYAPSTGTAAVETISGPQITEFVYANGLNLAINTKALSNYVSRMANAHSVFGPEVRFRTTGGGYLDIYAQKTGELVDQDKLYADLYACLQNRVSGDRKVSYKVVSGNDASANFDGNYVEVNLSAQHMWVYRNSRCVVSSDIVSGNVAWGTITRPGVFKIVYKTTNTYLMGSSYVHFWMPFDGGIGLHDATWRDTFGGDIYLTNGSHGCVNMPYEAAAATYENVSVGTYVVVYGGASVIDPQVINGTTAYTVTYGDAPFQLDAWAKYTTKLVYTSDNPNVVTVDSQGKVTIVGPGTAKITVTTEVDVGASLEVTVTVQPDPCASGNHTWDAGSVTTPASCETAGVKTFTCRHCGATRTETIPATGHSYEGGKCVHCGAPEPDAPPPEESTGPSEPETPEPPKEPELPGEP